MLTLWNSSVIVESWGRELIVCLTSFHSSSVRRGSSAETTNTHTKSLTQFNPFNIYPVNRTISGLWTLALPHVVWALTSRGSESAAALLGPAGQMEQGVHVEEPEGGVRIGESLGAVVAQAQPPPDVVLDEDGPGHCGVPAVLQLQAGAAGQEVQGVQHVLGLRRWKMKRNKLINTLEPGLQQISPTHFRGVRWYCDIMFCDTVSILRNTVDTLLKLHNI